MPANWKHEAEHVIRRYFPDGKVDTAERYGLTCNGVEFSRIKVSTVDALYEGMVDGWASRELTLHELVEAKKEIERLQGLYPHQSGDFTVIGPECFTNGEAICWKGEIFVRQAEPEASTTGIVGYTPDESARRASEVSQ